MSEPHVDDAPLKLPLIKCSPIAKAPLFEIQLFRSKLSFRNPKATAKVAKDLAGRKVDARPFLNTALKAEYDCNEELGRCITNVFFSAWQMQPKKFFASRIGSLNFYLNGLGVTRGDRGVYKDLYNIDTAKVWLKNFYSCRLSDLTTPEQERPETNKEFPVAIETIGENQVYLVKPRRNQIDFFVPFSAADLLQFSYQFSPKDKNQKPELAQAMLSVEKFARELVATVSLTQQIPDRN